MTRRSLLAAALLLLAACAADPARRQRIVMEEASRLRAPDVSLASYGKFELAAMAYGPEVAAKTEKIEAANRLGQQLSERLLPMFQAWEAAAPVDSRDRVVVVQPTVVGLRIVSGGARFLVGALAGDSSIDVDLSLVDKSSGRVIAKERIVKSTGGMAGAWSMGSTDRNLTTYVVDIAQQYLVNHHGK